MDYAATLETIKRKKRALEKRAADLKKKHSTAERKADRHLKIAVGAAILWQFDNPKVNDDLKAWVLRISDAGVQKQGLGREKFEALKAHLPTKHED